MTFLLPEIDISSIVIRKNMMAATTLTPKMFSLLDSLFQSDILNRHIIRRLDELKTDCKTSLLRSMIEAGKQSRLPSRVFHRAAQFYALKDEVILMASIQEKILLWQLSLAEAYQEYLYCSSNKFLPITNIRKIPKTDIPDLSFQQIQEELIDYADELDAWLEIEFSDEYDDYIEQPEFDIFVKIAATIRVLSDQL